MRFHLCALLLVHLTSTVTSQQQQPEGQHLDIDLAERGENPLTYKLNLTDGNVIVNITSASEGGFFVVQAHTLHSNVSLSKTEIPILGFYVVGTNVGMVETSLKAKTSYQYYVKPINGTDIMVLISVVLYGIEDPIPGGCNMVYNTEIAPYQILSYNDYMIQVDVAPALGLSCDVSFPRLDMYQLYLAEGTLDGEAYFDSIQKMMTVDGIKQYARKVTDSSDGKPLRRYYSAYPGVGSLYAIIANFGNASSAYVPVATYACDVNDWNESCVGPVEVIWKILFALILFMGVFMCFFGNRFFTSSLFVFGFVCGSFISYISLPFQGSSTAGYGFFITLGFGVLYGVMWIYFWARYGMPMLSVILPVFFTGYVIACTLYYMGLDDLPILESDLNYWSIFVSIIFITMILLLFCTLFGNIVPCSMIGASAIVITIDHYVGSTLHFALINNVRRLTITHFNLAILNPPYQYKDIILSTTWLMLIVLGIVAQFKQQIGKPPFPPRNFRLFGTRGNLSERTPLLRGAR